MYLWSNSLTLLLCAGLNGSGDKTPTAPPPTDPNPPIGPIIGGVVAGVVLIVVIILLIVVFFLMSKNERKLL